MKNFVFKVANVFVGYLRLISYLYADLLFSQGMSQDTSNAQSKFTPYRIQFDSIYFNLKCICRFSPAENSLSKPDRNDNNYLPTVFVTAFVHFHQNTN